jgi:hypothetical protein
VSADQDFLAIVHDLLTRGLRFPGLLYTSRARPSVMRSAPSQMPPRSSTRPTWRAGLSGSRDLVVARKRPPRASQAGDVLLAFLRLVQDAQLEHALAEVSLVQLALENDLVHSLASETV